MHLGCKLGLHKAVPSRLWNDGYYFSTCSRCGIPLVRRSEGRWQPVPRGHRIVWRPRDEDDIDWPQHLL